MKTAAALFFIILLLNCHSALNAQWRTASYKPEGLYHQAYPNTHPGNTNSSVETDYTFSTEDARGEVPASANSISSWSRDGKIHLKLSDTLFIQIFSLTGKVVFAEIISEGEYSFDLPRGVYFIRANAQTLKIVNK